MKCVLLQAGLTDALLLTHGSLCHPSMATIRAIPLPIPSCKTRSRQQGLSFNKDVHHSASPFWGRTCFTSGATSMSENSKCRSRRQARRIECQGVALGEAQTAEQLFPVETPVLPFRVGHGFDLHRLEPGLPLIIGGVNIPHDRGCEAHSDGDVLMHCVVDAILGALGLPDIGQLFPDNDPKWKGAASHVFMREAVRRMQDMGYTIGNLDATIILQRPKLSPHKPQIIANICELLQAPPSVVNIKAKTHEKVDSLGENRSVACHTVVLLMRK